jgi:hypothetical protein
MYQQFLEMAFESTFPRRAIPSNSSARFCQSSESGCKRRNVEAWSSNQPKKSSSIRAFASEMVGVIGAATFGDPAKGPDTSPCMCFLFLSTLAFCSLKFPESARVS